MGETVSMMKSLFVEDTRIKYTGEQLRSHWIYEKFDILGDTIVCFIGEADVRLNHMVDLQDVKEQAPIYSTEMLHFIIEHFNVTMQEIILRQRLFICVIQNALNEIMNANVVIRNGDDLFYNKGKLSVSIATLSPVSGLIHVGLNIDSKNAPVKASGLLSEMNIQNINNFAINLMKIYTVEYQQILKASYKVRPVF